MIFPELHHWIDPVARDGPHAMAVDEWLCGVVKTPLLRVYRWQGDWCSLGYFGEIAPAMARLACPNWVRRITGGGVVDHRTDWTYSLIIPVSDPLARLRGNHSYRLIHEALVRTLQSEGVPAHLSSGAAVPGESLCFANPVDHDLIDPHGQKLAGAGQRRSRHALLHQGSVIHPLDDADSASRTRVFANLLAHKVGSMHFTPDPRILARLVADRYGNVPWLMKR